LVQTNESFALNADSNQRLAASTPQWLRSMLIHPILHKLCHLPMPNGCFHRRTTGGVSLRCVSVIQAFYF